jgi:glucose/arabinose dehydrogenase
MFETEHGPSTYDGPPGGDEVNVIEAGNNYGWPVVDHERHADNMTDPKIIFTPAFAPASGMFYHGHTFPQFYGNFFFGGLVGEGIMRVTVEQSNPSKVLSYGKLAGIQVGRVRGITEGPDGYIYFATSNRDGRGTPRQGDDQIYRIVPQ